MVHQSTTFKQATPTTALIFGHFQDVSTQYNQMDSTHIHQGNVIYFTDYHQCCFGVQMY